MQSVFERCQTRRHACGPDAISVLAVSFPLFDSVIKIMKLVPVEAEPKLK